MGRKKASDGFAEREEAAGLEAQSAAVAEQREGMDPGNGTSPQAEGLARWRASGGRKGKMTYASFLVFGVRANGSQDLMHTAKNRYRCEKWLDMAAEIIARNYVGITVIKGRDVTPVFIPTVRPEGQTVRPEGQ